MYLNRIQDGHKAPSSSLDVKADCPWCRRHVVMERIKGVPDKAAPSGQDLGHRSILIFICLRQCPGCDGICVAFLRGTEDGSKSVYELWPKSKSAQLKEVRGMPEDISKAIDQAIVTHAQGMHDLAAVSIRKALEFICEDVGATGNRLVDKIKGLKQHLILPEEIVNAMDELRIFGNEGSHIFTRDYKIDASEVSIAIELVLEVNRAIYAHRHLLTKLKEFKLKKA